MTKEYSKTKENSETKENSVTEAIQVRFTLGHSISALVGFIGCLVASVLAGLPLIFGFVPGVALVFTLILRTLSAQGCHWRPAAVVYLKAMLQGIREGKAIYAIVALIGINIAMWLSSGVVAQLVVTGLDLARHINILLLSFLSMMAMSFVMGTSLGAVSTLGIALLGVGGGLGVSKPLLLGAIVSGGYLADRLSPVAGLVNTILTVMPCTYKAYFKASMRTLIPAGILAGIYYSLSAPDLGPDVLQDITALQTLFSTSYVLHPILYGLPLLILGMALLGFSTVQSMLGSSIGGILLATLLQKQPLALVMTHLWQGYSLAGGAPQVAALMRGGGLYPMLGIIAVIMAALAFSRLLSQSGILGPLTDGLMRLAKDTRSLLLGFGLSSAFFTSVACDQSLGIFIPPIIYGEAAKERGIPNVRLARAVGDFGIIIAPLEFWNLNAIIILSITGVSALHYWPFAVFCWFMPVIAILEMLFFTKEAPTHMPPTQG